MNTPENSPSPTRRSFVKQSVSAGLGFTFLPAYLTSARAADNPKLPPSRRINLGCIGVGGRAGSVIPGLTEGGAATPVAFTDVDFVTAKGLEKNLTAFPDVKRFHDFREMLDKMGKDIDAVSVVIPDHTHFTAAIHAMALGKHVYVEKPLTHTFEEAEILMRAEKKFKVVTQMGNQGHTSAGAEQFKQMLAAGIVDDIVKIDAWKSPSLWFMNAAERALIKGYPPEEPMPESLKSWDLWCGPQEMKPFSKMYHPFNWRGFHLYGGGMFGDWGAHIIDFVHDHLKLGLPTRITPLALEDYNQISYPLSSDIRFEFPERGDKMPAVELHWKAGGDTKIEIPEKFGDPDADGKIVIPNPGNTGSLLHRKQGDYLVQRGSHDRHSIVYPRAKMVEFKDAMALHPPKYNHFQSFIQACMGNGSTQSPFSIGGALTQVLNLGTIAEYLNVDLQFDPKTKRFINNEAANARLAGPPPRAEWADCYKLA
ncbi:MAG: Gfo/Idh/MocA family oxidoreductase [Prosthecobacter sp.]|uniref:Gfo/Idh/MocA family oxidoreductase n=1 Tax=Prosthecobacter sp. TaxID=1965333 RepID=UPI00261FE877|nr:Gfo/Idh/MocA family oxidoreductase [Prosthecobacter sp.]MCF7789305.1 Gfo/Idh/MocA family oxidoreductase [Prosthecobacter sp.]